MKLLPRQGRLASFSNSGKDFVARNKIIASLSLPMMLFVSVLITTPAVLTQGMSIGITTAVMLTALAEVFVLAFALWYVGAMDIWTERLRLRNFKISTFAIGILAGTILFVGLQFFSQLITKLVPNGNVESSDTSVSMSDLVGLEKYIVLIGFVAILGPFLEELFFRGYTMGFIYDASKNKKLGAIVAILLSSVFFSFAHWQGLNNASDYFHMVWIFLVAVINSLLVLKFDSIWPAFGSHMAYNGITVVFMLMGAVS